jgi:hypothetical protein
MGFFFRHDDDDDRRCGDEGDGGKDDARDSDRLCVPSSSSSSSYPSSTSRLWGRVVGSPIAMRDTTADDDRFVNVVAVDEMGLVVEAAAAASTVGPPPWLTLRTLVSSPSVVSSRVVTVDDVVLSILEVLIWLSTAAFAGDGGDD